MLTIKDSMPSGFPDDDLTPSAFSSTGDDEPEDGWLGDLRDDAEITVNRSVNTYLKTHIKVSSNVLI